MARDEGGAIRMGSEGNPVVLDFYQTIVEVGWPPTIDYAVVPVSVFYEWNAQDSSEITGGESEEIHRDWEPGEICETPLREVVEPQGEFATGVIVPHYLTGLRISISFGTDAKLRRKRKERNTDGELESRVEWKSGTVGQPITEEKYGYPKEKIYGTFHYVGSTTLDSVSAAPAFEMFVRDPEGAEVLDKDGEVVYMEGAEGPTDLDSETPVIPYRIDNTLGFYLWGWAFTEAPICTHFTGTANFTVQAAAIEGPTEFENESVDLSGLEIIVKRMKFRQVGMAMDLDGSIGILFERVPGEDQPQEPTA